ncbi:polyhomeotic-like protein 2 [Dermacentor albipictus]|uniref:polyhomeotic-like protein 2 n=1 Tax=Dermacentor albipictus TaxID=60249 RepID=UPI0031FBE7D6
MPMRGQKTRGRASAGTCRSPRGTPPYFSERQRGGSQPSLRDAGEAPPPVPETRELSVSELFSRLPSHFVSKPGVTTHVIDGFVIQESPEPFTTTAETTSAVGAQHNCRVSSDAPPPPPSHPAPVTTPDPSPSRARPAKSTPCGRQGRKAADPFLVQTAQPPVTTRTPAATSTAHSTPERTPMSSASEKTVAPTPMTQSAAHATAAKSKGTSASPPNKTRRETASQVFIAPPQQPTPPPPPRMNSPEVWTVEDVVEFIAEQPGCERYAEKFRYQEIDGEALLLLKEHHLMAAMNMKLGPALKVCAVISSLRAAP